MPPETEKQERTRLIDRAWSEQDSSMEGYSKTIDRLLRTLTIQQLREFVGDEEADEEVE